jgi:hypothetical protein
MAYNLTTAKDLKRIAPKFHFSVLRLRLLVQHFHPEKLLVLYDHKLLCPKQRDSRASR